VERTFVMVKPDGVQRGLVGEILRRLEGRGLRLVGLRLLRVSPELAARHYAEHRGKPFYDGLIDFITSGPAVASAWEGHAAVEVVRTMIGATDPRKSPPGTIRGDFGIDMSRNVIHGAANLDDAAREIALYFAPVELLDYRRVIEDWVYEGP
jgi:nucleoside-diphosphate kinase